MMTKIIPNPLRYLLAPWIAFAVALVALLIFGMGCRATYGRGYSYHRVETYSTNGTLLARETWKDRNGISSGGAFSSAEASAFKHERTNFLGTASKTSLGKYGDKPDADSIKAAGEAAGKVIGEALKTAVKPTP